MPGALAQIAVGADGDAWGLNAQSNIYHYNAQTAGFSQVSGSLAQIAVGSSGSVYGVNSAGSIYWYNPGTGYFQWVATSIGFTQISVGADGDVWAVKNNAAYHYDVLHNSMAATSASIAKVMVGYGAAVWGLDSSGNIWQWQPASSTWVQIAGTLSSIAVGTNGSMWVLNSSQQIFQLTGGTTRPYQTLSTVAGASLDQISVGADGSAWGVKCTSIVGTGNNQTCGSETVYHFNTGTQSFQAVPGAPNLVQVSVGAGANVWGVDRPAISGNTMRLAGSWNNIPGELNLVQVGANGAVWGINGGSTFTYNFSSSWTRRARNFRWARMARWGQGQLQVYRYNGTSWVNVPGSLSEVSVGNANNIWGVNAQGQVYQYNSGIGYTNIPGVTLAEVWATYDGAVWGVNTQGSLYEYNSGTQKFTQVTGNVTQVLVGNDASVWATNATTGSVYSWF